MPFESVRTALAGRYTIETEVGRGGMGVVYRGRDLRLGRPVAIKMLLDPVANDAAQAARFRREARILASLQHPHIAAVYALEEPEPGSLLLVLEWIGGGTLADRLRAGGLPIGEALEICRQVADALMAAHERKVIHRDLKPSNVMFDTDGQVRVLDFGIARQIDTVDGNSSSGLLTPPGEVLGTARYMSPEQVCAAPLDARTDVFSFGCLLFECLTRRPAFDGRSPGEMMASVMHVEPSWAALPAGTPAAVRALLFECLTKDRERRTADIRLARDRLASVVLGADGSDDAALYATLPVEMTRFVGRRDELSRCERLLSDHRLLTITGPGGAGKTRLALQVAQRSRPQSPGGIHVADLSSTADPGRVEHVVGAALRVPEQPGQPPVEGIAAALRGRPALLVLDNCEHVLAACAALARALLAGCPEARILATSREPLGLPGEQTFPVPPLSLPPAGGDLGTLLESDAVQLFLDRARLIVPDFMVDAADAPVVVEICRRLDGIPLAIEIAAARVRVLSPRQIQARLDDRLRMLTGKGDTGSRHRTLWAAFQWSYDLLEADDQRHFRSLAVFAGGWPLEATAAIWGGVDEDEALERIEQLVSKSLVTVQTRGDGEPRYRLLETLRQFAWAQLDGQGESAACRDRHLEYYLARGEQAEHELWGASQAAWLAWLDREHDNLLAALDWALARSAGDDAALRLAGSLRRFWNIRGYLSVGVRALDSALRHDPQAANRPARGRALDGVANLSLLSGDYARAREAFEASLVLHREIDGRQGIARALTGLGHVASQQHDYAAARARYEESLAVSRDTDDRQGIAAALGNLAGIAVVQGDYEAARGPMSECVELFERLGNLHNVAIGLSTLAFLDLRLGNPSSARSRLRRCLTLVRDLGATRAGAAALETAAELAHEAGAAEDAARFFAAAGHLRDSSGAPLGPDEKRQQEEIVGAVRSRLGEARFHRFWSEGETRSLAVAVEDALAWLDAAPSERA